jgi:hypothetical protein
VHIAIVDTFEVSAKSEAFHLLKEIRVIGECVFEWAVPLTSLPHEDAPAFLCYLCFNDSWFFSELVGINLAFEDCLNRFKVAVRA